MATTWTCLLVLAVLAGRVAVEAGLAVARPGPHVVQQAAQQRVAEGEDPLTAFGQCHEHCIGTYKQCQSGCADNQGHNDIPCIERCIDEQLIGCSCGCAALLPPETPESRISGTAVLRTPALSWGAHLALPELPAWATSSSGLRDEDSAQKKLDCFKDATAQLDACAQPCVAARDVECALVCIKPNFQRICGCGGRDWPTTASPDASTAAPTAAPVTTAKPSSAERSVALAWAVLAAAVCAMTQSLERY